jgi:hypothetical protein
MSAVAEFGFTAMNDGTAALQPWGTVMAFNKVHEIGLYEVQSSALFLGKTPLTRLEGNLLFNGPRAMVNGKYTNKPNPPAHPPTHPPTHF